MTVDLNTKNLKIAVDYLQRQAAALQVKEDELARRMGIDPDKDILIIPERIVAEYGVYHFPRWMKVSKYVQEAYIAVGVRDKNCFERERK